MNHSTQCKHKPVHEIENKLYPDYDDGMLFCEWCGMRLRAGPANGEHKEKFRLNLLSRSS
jgi:hypothetical protein